MRKAMLAVGVAISCVLAFGVSAPPVDAAFCIAYANCGKSCDAFGSYVECSSNGPTAECYEVNGNHVRLTVVECNIAG